MDLREPHQVQANALTEPAGIFPSHVWIITLLSLVAIIACVAVTWSTSDPSLIRFFDNAHWTIGTTMAAVLSTGAFRNASVQDRYWLIPIVIGMIAYALGQWVFDVQIYTGYADFPAPSDLVYLWLGPCLIYGMWRGARQRTTTRQSRIILMDMLIASIAVLALVMALYLPKRGGTDDLSLAVMIAYPVTWIGASIISLLMLVSLRLRQVWGWILFTVMLLLSGMSWMLWNNLALDSEPLDALWFNGIFSISILVIGAGLYCLRFDANTSPKWDRICEGILRLLPLMAVVVAALAVVFANTLQKVPQIVHDTANFGALGVIVLAAFRQGMLLRERDQLLVEQAARNRAETALQESEERWKFALEGAGDGVWDWDIENGSVYFSRLWKEMIGYAEHELENSYEVWEQLLHPEDRAKAVKSLQDHLKGIDDQYQPEFRMRCKDGSWKWIRSRGMIISRDDVGRALRMIGTHVDITRQKESEEVIWRQANYDALTGLPNRYMFRNRLEQELATAQRSGQKMALLFIDLDLFKEVNDTLGHAVGDQLLVQAGRRILDCVRDTDAVARLGGDEFTILLTRLSDTLHVETIAETIIDQLSRQYKLDDEIAYVSASIGITLFPDDSSDIVQLYRNADQAMYHAKKLGRRRFCYFTYAMQESARHRMQLIRDLREAAESRQFELYCQPVIEMNTGAIVEAEALIRWNHPQRGMVSPGEFIPLAEESGLIHEIGEWVFREAVAIASRCNSGDSQVKIGINLSPVQFSDSRHSAEHWIEYLRRHHLETDRLIVEITEGVLLDAEAGVTEKLFAFRDSGVQVAIDDFGTGYSSLSYLNKFDIDYLKIDRSFVQDIEVNLQNQALSEAIIIMAHKLGLKVVAEGVEQEGQHHLLKGMGCDFAQGYFYYKPMPSADFERLVRTS